MNLSILNELINSTEEAILIIEGNREITFSNNRANALLNSGKSIIGRDIRNLLNASASGLFEREFFQLTEKSLVEVYFNTFMESEQLNSLRFRVKPFNDNQFIVTITALEKSEPYNAYQLYKLLAENAYDINLMFQKDELMYISPSIFDFLGYFESEILSMKDWLSLIHSDDLESVKKELKSDSENNISYSFIIYRQKHKKGHYLWFESKIRREFQHDGSIVNILTSLDITQRKKAEIALEKQKEFIEELFDTDPNLIFVKDGSGKIIYCNKAVADLVGISREEFLAIEDNTFPAPKKKAHMYAEMENKVINHGQEILIEEKIEDKDGVVNHFQTLKKPLKMKDGDTNLLNISTNINKIKYYQEQSQKAMSARTEFFSALSHEIRTPMNAIMGMTDLMLKRKPREDQIKLLQALHFSSKNLLNLINDVLDFSKIEAGKIEIEEINFNLKDLIENIHLGLKPKALSKNLTLGLSYDERTPFIVKGDSIKMSQILNNLVGNAIKFTEKGYVSLEVALKEKKNTGYLIQFNISDSGIGIPNSKLKEIFNPFQQASSSTTRKFGGTGLGLTIVKNLVELLKGKIEVESEEDKGSIFKVEIPFKISDSKTLDQPLFKQANNESNWKLDLHILYVEDVLTNQYLIEEILKDWGVTVDVASNGIEAIEKIKSRKYDLILMDIQMPEMDGYQASKIIREMEDDYFHTIPILALTANTSKSTKDKIIKSGMQDHIIKPVNIDELRDKIVKHSKLKDQVNLRLLVDTEETEIKVLSSISYDQTDQLFLNNIVRYQEFLKKTFEEFEINYQEMVTAMQKADSEQFRRIHHRMKSILATLNMNDLASVIEDVKEKITKKGKKFKSEAELSNLKFQFDFVLDSLTNKLSSLKWH